MDVLWEPVVYGLLGLAFVLVRLSEWWFGWDFERWMYDDQLQKDQKARQAASLAKERRDDAKRSEAEKILRARTAVDVLGQLMVESPKSAWARRLREDEEMRRMAAVLERERNDPVPRSDLDKLLRRQLP